MDGAFTIRFKNPFHNEYDAVQIECQISMEVALQITNGSFITGKINDMKIIVTKTKAFYFDESSNNVQDHIDNLVGIFMNSIESTLRKGVKIPTLGP